LKRIDLSRLNGGDWHLATLQTYGAIYEAQGKTNQAIVSYRAALSVTSAQAGFLRSVSNKIDRLTGKQGETK
jgi:predicted negative regulator of RcsB-dependent stress response